MDALSQVLSLLKPRNAASAGLDAGGAWAIRFPPHEGIKFNAVLRGSCWVSVEGEAAAQRVAEGDCFLLTRGRPFTVATDPSRPTVAAEPIYARAPDGIAIHQGGGDFLLVGGRFAFDGGPAAMLIGALPALLHVRDATAQAGVLRWALENFAVELRQMQPGGALAIAHLAQLMLVQVLRLFLAAGPEGCAGWLSALADPRLARAIGAIHADPARRWTVADLAALAGMSRSSFAERFRRIVGHPPLAYLGAWRMALAADRLRRTDDSVAQVAAAAGYASEAAFRTRFRHRTGRSPARYRRPGG
ncbi:AraC family transcriptional regulator [Methylobacterium sp. JK268]